MKSLKNDMQSGQALVQVALMMVVLIAFVALAVDVGHIYSERRHMQNAADAGALAGAWELCFGDAAQAQATALQYTINRNGAQTATANIAGGWRVNVEARTVADTYFAGIIGVNNVPVTADAEAACSGSRNLCDLWPVTFNVDRWDNIPCGQDFYVWNDDRLERENVNVRLADGTVTQLPVCTLCDCQTAFGAPDGNIYLIGPGNRGWVNFPRPEPPYPDDNCTNNCGSNQAVCIIDDNGYSGSIEIPPGGICLPGQPGVASNVLHAIERNLNEEVNLLLWDRECTGGEPVTGTCSGTPYHITGTGCVVALSVPTIDLPKNPLYADARILDPGWPNSPNMCMQNVKTVLARKSCSCESSCGSTTGGGPPNPSEVRSVSLIR